MMAPPTEPAEVYARNARRSFGMFIGLWLVAMTLYAVTIFAEASGAYFAFVAALSLMFLAFGLDARRTYWMLSK